MSASEDEFDYDSVPLSFARANNRYDELGNDDEPPESPRSGSCKPMPVPGLGLSRLGSGDSGQTRSAALPPGSLKLKLPARMPVSAESPATRRGGPEQGQLVQASCVPNSDALEPFPAKPALKPPKLNLTNAASASPTLVNISSPWATAAVNNRLALNLNGLEPSLSLSSTHSLSVSASTASSYYVDLISPAFAINPKQQDGAENVSSAANTPSAYDVSVIKQRCSVALGISQDEMTLYSLRPLEGPGSDTAGPAVRIGVMVNRSGFSMADLEAMLQQQKQSTQMVSLLDKLYGSCQASTSENLQYRVTIAEQTSQLDILRSKVKELEAAKQHIQEQLVAKDGQCRLLGKTLTTLRSEFDVLKSSHIRSAGDTAATAHTGLSQQAATGTGSSSSSVPIASPSSRLGLTVPGLRLHDLHAPVASTPTAASTGMPASGVQIAAASPSQSTTPSAVPPINLRGPTTHGTSSTSAAAAASGSTSYQSPSPSPAASSAPSLTLPGSAQQGVQPKPSPYAASPAISVQTSPGLISPMSFASGSITPYSIGGPVGAGPTPRSALDTGTGALPRIDSPCYTSHSAVPQAENEEYEESMAAQALASGISSAAGSPAPVAALNFSATGSGGAGPRAGPTIPALKLGGLGLTSRREESRAAAAAAESTSGGSDAAAGSVDTPATAAPMATTRVGSAGKGVGGGFSLNLSGLSRGTAAAAASDAMQPPPTTRGGRSRG